MFHTQAAAAALVLLVKARAPRSRPVTAVPLCGSASRCRGPNDRGQLMPLPSLTHDSREVSCRAGRPALPLSQALAWLDIRLASSATL